MGKQRLDPKLLAKLARRLRKKPQYVREQISRRASRDGISSEAALVARCNEHGIGTAAYLNRLPVNVRDQVRDLLSRSRATPADTARLSRPRAERKDREIDIRRVVDMMVKDGELRERCRDLLAAKKHYDRVLREATTVLDDRLKRLSGIWKMNPADLVGKSLNPDPSKAVIEVSSDPNEQRGIHAICSGIMLAFRNKAHHTLSNSFSQEDALKFCGFVDTLLAILASGTRHPDRV